MTLEIGAIAEKTIASIVISKDTSAGPPNPLFLICHEGIPRELPAMFSP